MTVLSTLCRLNRLHKPLNLSNISKLLVAKQQNAFMQVVRKMSGGDDRTMNITPSRYHYTRFKDDLHLYLSIGIIPLALLIMYVNIFIGPATLTEIPEDYEPRHWEYYRHPISRFFAKHFYEEPQVVYERTLHGLVEEHEHVEWQKTIDKVHKLMAERDDYKAWYFLKSEQGRQIRFARSENEVLEEDRGYR